MTNGQKFFIQSLIKDKNKEYCKEYMKSFISFCNDMLMVDELCNANGTETGQEAIAKRMKEIVENILKMEGNSDD